MHRFFETEMGRKTVAFFSIKNPPFSDINTNIESIIGLVSIFPAVSLFIDAMSQSLAVG